MTWVRWVLVAYGVLMIAMGIDGMESSPISLYAGAGAGLLILGCVWISLKKTPRAGYIPALIISFLLFGRFFKPAFMDGQMYPGMVAAIASLIAIASLLGGHMMAKKKSAS